MSEPTPPRILCRIERYGDLLHALRTQLEKIQIWHEVLDEISGATRGLSCCSAGLVDHRHSPLIPAQARIQLAWPWVPAFAVTSGRRRCEAVSGVR
jgi:hypothetical protein